MLVPVTSAAFVVADDVPAEDENIAAAIVVVCAGAALAFGTAVSVKTRENVDSMMPATEEGKRVEAVHHDPNKERHANPKDIGGNNTGGNKSSNNKSTSERATTTAAAIISSSATMIAAVETHISMMEQVECVLPL